MQGGFASVWLCTVGDQEMTCAMKEFILVGHGHGDKADADKIWSFEHEVEKLKQLRHKNIEALWIQDDRKLLVCLHAVV